MTTKKANAIVTEEVPLGALPKKKPGRKPGSKPELFTGVKLAERCVNLAKKNEFTIDQLIYFLNKYRDIAELELQIEQAKAVLHSKASELQDNPELNDQDYTVGDVEPFGNYEVPF